MRVESLIAAHLPDEELPRLYRRLLDPRKKIRAYAQRRIAQGYAVDVGACYRQVLAEAPPERMDKQLISAIKGLREIGQPADESLLAPLLDTPAVAVRCQALAELAACTRDAARLAPCLRAREPELRQTAVLMTILLNGDRDVIRQWMRDGESPVRRAIVTFLASYDIARYRDLYLEWLLDADPAVARAAAKAVRQHHRLFDLERLRAQYAEVREWPARYMLLLLADLLPWETLPLLFELEQDLEESEESLDLLYHWVRRSHLPPPTAEQLERARTCYLASSARGKYYFRHEFEYRLHALGVDL